MNTEQKTYGQICMDAYSTCILPGQAKLTERWEAAAQAVISAYKERETVEGWRLLEKWEPLRDSDEYYSPNNGWTHWDGKAMKYKVPFRRRARFLRDSHQQDETSVAQELAPRSTDDHVAGSPAGGTTPEGGDTFRAGMDRAIDTVSAIRALCQNLVGGEVLNQIIVALKRKRDEHRPQEKEEYCSDCGRPLSQCGDPSDDGEPSMDCLVCRMQDKILDLANENDRLKEELAEAKERLVEYLDSPDNQNRTAAEKLETANRYISELEEELAACRKELDASGLNAADFRRHAWDQQEKLRRDLADAKRQLTEARWIPVSERMPTKEDADMYGRVLWANHAATIAPCYIIYGAWNVKPIESTHWMPVPPLPKPQEDEFDKFMRGRVLVSDAMLELAREAWNAALASGKEKP